MRLLHARTLCLAVLAGMVGVVAGCVDLTAPELRQFPNDHADGPRVEAGRDADPPDSAPNDDPIANGKPCLHGGQCASGLCTEGVCCASDCGGRCQSCKVAGREGACVPVPAGQDPREQCALMEPATCLQDGTCDGAGNCRLYVMGSECAPAGCSGSSERAAGTCDGTGGCRPGNSRSCAPLVCQGGSCGTACTSDTQCLTGFFCESGTCRLKRAQGAACTQPWQCATGQCVDGVCCNSACSQACHTCNPVGSPGVCTPAAPGTDPRAECGAMDPSTCGNTGECDGMGACQLHRSGTACGAAATCGAGVETSARTCNGLGVCLNPITRACSPYACAGNVCATSCTMAGQCQSGYTCTGNACVPSTPVDAGPGPGVLVLDDFADSNLRSNKLGGAVTWDNENVSLVGGEQKFVWNGTGVFHDFIETFRTDWCEYSLNAYTKLRMRLRSSVAGRRVDIYMATMNGTCGATTENKVGTITLSTTMTSYEFDITGIPRGRARTVELAPLQPTPDTAEYFVDDIVLVP